MNLIRNSWILLLIPSPTEELRLDLVYSTYILCIHAIHDLLEQGWVVYILKTFISVKAFVMLLQAVLTN